MLLITYLMSILTIFAEAEIIHVKHGEITGPKGVKCTISSNGIVKNHTFQDNVPMDGLWFGKIEYGCGDTFGELMSKIECKRCGLFCKYNELFPKCKQDGFYYTLGLLTAIILNVIISYLARRKLFVFYNWVHHKINYIHQMYKDRQANKLINRIRSNTNMDVQVKYKDYKELLPEDLKKIRQSRSVNSKEMPSEILINEPSTSINLDKEIRHLAYELDCCDNNVETGKVQHNEQDSDVDANQSKDTKVKRLYPLLPKKTHNSSLSGLAGAAMATMLMSHAAYNPTLACDTTLYVHSEGKVCYDGICRPLHVSTFPISTGETLCLVGTNGEQTSLKILETSVRRYYKAVYLTAKYKLEQEHEWNCEWKGECSQSTCKVGYRWSGFKNKTKIQGFTCMEGTIGCNTFCSSTSKCVYTHWWLTTDGYISTVYKKFTKGWEGIVEIQHNNTIRRITVNTENPRLGVQSYNLGKSASISLYMTSVYYNDKEVEDYVLSTPKGYINFVASELNYPETEKIGDYQIALDMKSYTFNEHNVRCDTVGCVPTCLSPPSAFGRLAMHNPEQPTNTKYITADSNSYVEMRTSVKSTVNILLGNFEPKGLNVTHAGCKIELVGTYACTGCDMAPYAVTRAYDIKIPGILTFESNCSFTTNYISCNPELYTLELDEESNHCNIYISAINVSMMINFDYIFTGNLDPSHSLIGEDRPVDAIHAVLSDMRFWSSLVQNLSIMSFVGICCTVFIKIVQVIWGNRIEKEVAQQIKD